MDIMTNYNFSVTPSSSTENATVESASKTTGHDEMAFVAAVITIGVTGTLANGLVLYILSASNQMKKQAVNILIVNQLSLDLFGSFWLAVIYSVKITNIYIERSTGYWVCIFIISEDFSWFGIYGSKLNLMVIAVERYFKIVHPIWHKKNARSWMTYGAVAISWIAGVSTTQSTTSLTTAIIDGGCYWGMTWASESAKNGFAITIFCAFFAVPFVSFLFCYGSIIYVLRRQTKIFAAQHANNPSTKTNNSLDMRIQMNAVKTMIIISVAFVMCWLPCDLYVLLVMIKTDSSVATSVYYTTVCIGFFNICLNPFIYAAKYDIVKNYLSRFMTCQKTATEQTLSTNPNLQNDRQVFNRSSQLGLVIASVS